MEPRTTYRLTARYRNGHSAARYDDADRATDAAARAMAAGALTCTVDGPDGRIVNLTRIELEDKVEERHMRFSVSRPTGIGGAFPAVDR